MDSLDLIQTFREVARRGSFSAAARALDMSPANVSKYVAQLEVRFGVRLFHRTTRKVSLTDAGELLYERSAALLELIDLTEGELQVSKAGRPLGRLKKGDCFGEMAVIRKHRPPRNADISALSAANIVTIRGEALEQASEACRMHFFQGFVEVLANRLASANQRIASR